LLFQCLPFGDIARDFGEPTNLTGFVVQGGQHHIGPETRAILTHAPALIFNAAISRGGPEQLLWLAALHVLVRIETGEVLADDLLSGIPLQAFSSGIPGSHVPVGSHSLPSLRSPNSSRPKPIGRVCG
jgi:hypothetical protein